MTSSSPLVDPLENPESQRALAVINEIRQYIDTGQGSDTSPEDLYRWTQTLDPDSFGKMIIAYAWKAGYHYPWSFPSQREGEDDRSYMKRAEASFVELTGVTLSNMLLNARSWIGTWAAMILDHGLTLIPEFAAADDTSSLKRPLELWFERTGLHEHLRSYVYSRLKAFLLEDLPWLRLQSPRIDKAVIPLLTHNEESFGIPKTVRVTIDAIRIARQKHDGKVPRELTRLLVENIENGGKHPGELEAAVHQMGYTPEWVNKKLDPIAVGAWVYSKDGVEAIDYLIEARGPKAIEFMEAQVGRAPFVLRNDLGGDSDARRTSYKTQLADGSNDHGRPELLPGEPGNPSEH